MRSGWQTKTIGDVCQFRGGGTPSKSVARYWRGDIPWVSPKDMKSEVVADSIDHISQDGIHDSAASLIPEDSILMVVRSGILARTVPLAISGRELAINQDLKALCPTKAIQPRFLYHLLSSKMDALLSMVSRGATVHRITTEQIRKLEFYLPPLSEQQRVVAILDEAFAGIATAKANAEKNLQNARALFLSALNTVIPGGCERDTPNGWRLEKLAALSTGISDGVHKTPRYIPEGIPFVTVKNLTAGPGISFESVKYISTADHEEFTKRTKPERGDILITKDGTIGVVRVVETDTVFSIFVSVALIKPRDRAMGPYLVYALTAPVVQRQIVPQGTALKHLYLVDLRNLQIPVPPSTERQRIVEQLNELKAECENLEKGYQRKLAALDALKKSLLHRAFAGELTASKRKRPVEAVA